MLHAGFGNTRAATLGSTIASSDYGVGVYGGGTSAGTRLALGALYTRHDIHSRRNIAFPGFTGTLAADHAAGTAQAFAELSHEFDLGAVSLRPYGGFAYVRQANDGFAETGGAAALSGAGSAMAATFASLGVQAERTFVVGDDMVLTASGSLGWRRAFAETPTATYALAGGSGFSVVGTPIAGDTIGVRAGFSLEIGDTTMLDVDYDGEFGGGAETHALNGTWATRF
jgi:outer membrane autotransporter protein